MKEIAEFAVMCATEHVKIVAVPADGHCLFHALATAVPAPGRNYQTLRNMAAEALLRDTDAVVALSHDVDAERVGEDVPDPARA